MLINTDPMIVLCIVVFIYFIFNIMSIVNVFMLSIEKKEKKSVLFYKLFLSLNIRDFSLFFVKNCNPSLKKVTPSLSQQPPLKMEVLSSQRCNHPPPPPKQKGGVHTMSWLNSLLSWDFLWQDKKIKINEIINGSVIFKYNSYLNTLNTELWWSCSFFYIDSFHIVHNRAN